jgi:hypothetical protein
MAVDAAGKFCFWASPGEYTVSAPVSAAEKAAGLVLAPESMAVTLTAPVLDLLFSPVRTSVSGVVTCLLRGCPTDGSLKVELSSRVTGTRVSVTAAADGTFTFSDVVPGTYVLAVRSLLMPQWCWGSDVQDASPPSAEAAEQQVVVGVEPVTGLLFSQGGYQASVASPSPGIALQLEAPDGRKSELQLQAGGENKYCLRSLEQHTATPVGCYLFSKKSYSVKAGARLVVDVTHFRVTGTVEVDAALGTSAMCRSSCVWVLQLLLLVFCVLPPPAHTFSFAGPWVGLAGATVAVTADSTSGTETVLADASGTYQHWAKVGELVSYVPMDATGSVSGQQLVPSTAPDRLVFTPSSAEVRVYTDVGQCPAMVPKFTGRAGMVLRGVVRQPLEDVLIRVFPVGADEATDAPVAEVRTDASGEYAAGPLTHGMQYTVTAEKLGFHFKRSPATGDNDFVHKQLGRLEVAVAEASSQQGVGAVLLSLVGDSYRQNSHTDSGGKLVFYSLFPGSYFVRPQLKEYRFTPPTATVDVGDGTAATASFQATRVAFSAFGTVRSLNGAPQAGVAVQAKSVGGGHHEDTLSGADGHFRIRGLLPGETYSVEVPRTEVVGHAAPAATVVTMANQDVRGLGFVSFSAPASFSVSAEVLVEKEEWRQSLTVVLASAADPGTALRKLPCGLSPYMEFSGLPAGAYVLKLTSSLSERDYTIRAVPAKVALGGAKLPSRVLMSGAAPEAVVARQGDLQAHAVLRFSASARPLSEDVNSSSMGLLLLAVALCAAFIYQDALLKLPALFKTGSTENVNDDTDFLSTVDTAPSKSRKRRR